MAVYSELLLVILSLGLVEINGKAFVRLCYYQSWANTRPSLYARCDISDIPASLCTHLLYAFATVDPVSHRLIPSNAGDDDSPGQVGRYRMFNDIKKTHPHVKTLLSIGGETTDKVKSAFVNITRNDQILNSFVQTTVRFLRKRSFDGLDVDWEFIDAQYKTAYIKVIKALRTAFESDKYGGQRLLLTAALKPTQITIDTGYDVAALNKYLDLATLMTYDYHGGWSDVTSFDSPLFSRYSDPSFNHQYSTNWTVNYYLQKGLRAEKLVVGVTAAGTRFKLLNSSLTGVGAPVIKPPENAPLVSGIWQLPNRYAYPEICRLLQDRQTVRVMDPEQQVPYVHSGDEWSGYEDVESLQNKMDWMLKKGLAGVMVWSVDLDDVTGKVCDSGTYPFLRALSRGVEKHERGQLTRDVNPNIRYLTKYSRASRTAGVLAWTVLLCAILPLLWGL